MRRPAQELADDMAHRVVDHLERLGTRLDIAAVPTGPTLQHYADCLVDMLEDNLETMAVQLAQAMASARKITSFPLEIPRFHGGHRANNNSICLRYLEDYMIGTDELIGRFDVLYQAQGN